MAFLSTLLNPSPTGDESQQSPTEARKNSLSQSEQQQSQGVQASPEFHAPEYRPALSSTTRDAASTLASLSTSNAPPPSWSGYHYSDGASNSPTDVHAEIRRLSAVRRPSTYGENTGHFELPQPPEVARKMSSPTLDQYHVASRSPEQTRRPSLYLSGDDGLTLPPIHSAASAHQQQAPVGRDTSVALHDEGEQEKSHAQKPDVVAEIQNVADNREPDYKREEATTNQIRRPSATEVEVSARRESLASLGRDQAQGDTNKLETETRPTPSAHPPFTTLKQEHSTHTNSPLRESSVPVPSTEMPAPTTSSVPRKRPPPKSAGKKGTASSVKKEPPTKKRKTEPSGAKRSGTPSSLSQKSKGALANTKKLASNSATPANGSPAPRSVRTASTPARSVASNDLEADNASDNEDEEEQGTPDSDAELYCLCRRPDTGTFMIGCDGGCDDWFHGKCVGIAERDKGLIDRYVCPRCSEKGLGPTTWKRMCRRNGCRLPARVQGMATGKKGKKETTSSKYCSDACGVQYFKELLVKTRGASETSPSNPKGKKNSIVVASQHAEEDLGPRGGSLSAPELKSLMTIAKGVDDFKRFGEGILSPPATPSPPHTSKQKQKSESSLSSTEQEHLTSITSQKDATRARHSLLKDRLRLITLLKQTATTLAEQRGLKPKEFCGFDSRVTWTDDEFDIWRSTPSGKESLSSGTLNIADADGDTGMTDGNDDKESGGGGGVTEPCDKKRCARHHDWAKLALDDTRFEMSENSETMRRLDRAEKDLLQRAGLRARVLKAGGAGGDVVFEDVKDEVMEEPKKEEVEQNGQPSLQREESKQETTQVGKGEVAAAAVVVDGGAVDVATDADALMPDATASITHATTEADNDTNIASMDELAMDHNDNTRLERGNTTFPAAIEDKTQPETQNQPPIADQVMEMVSAAAAAADANASA